MTIHPYWIVIFTLVMASIPILVSLGTSFIKVQIVLGMLRSGLGTQNIPGTIVIAAMSLGVTAVVMQPVVNETLDIVEDLPALTTEKPPSLINFKDYSQLLKPWKKFMERHSGAREIKVFLNLHSSSSNYQINKQDHGEFDGNPMAVVIPAFLVSELKEAFAMAFALLLPFLVIDVVVSNILVGLGMYMVSPVLISLPLKLLVFVLSDGWLLLVHGLIKSYEIGG